MTFERFENKVEVNNTRMMVFNCIILILLFQDGIADKNTLPVIMLDEDNVMVHVQVDPNPFAKMSTASFSDILHDSIMRSESIVLFIENFLSTEDLSTRDKFGNPFVNLRAGLGQNRVKYFPNVLEPYKLLNQIFQPQQYNVFYIRTRTKLQLIDNYKYIYVFFQDGVNETRTEVLRRHDAIIKDVIYLVRQLKSGPVIAFYTGKTNPVVVQKTKFVPVKPRPVPRDLGIMVVSSGALFRFIGVFAATTTRKAMFNQLPMVAEETFTRRSMSTKMAYTDFELEFNFSFKDEGWTIENVALLEAGEEVGRTEMGVGAPWNWSYVCGEPLIIINTRDGSSVTISQYQIQPRVKQYRPDGLYQLVQAADNSSTGSTGSDGKTDSGTQCFGKSINCGPYFNTNILAGLLVAALCLSITMYGIISLMDIRTNDRYEDPLGKPLQLRF